MHEVAADIVDLGGRVVVLEEGSHSTRLNAEELKRIMDERGWKTAVVVAQQLHVKRVRATFRRLMPASEGYKIYVVAAWSLYGGSSKWIFCNFWTFCLWDRVIAWTIFRLKGWI